MKKNHVFCSADEVYCSKNRSKWSNGNYAIFKKAVMKHQCNNVCMYKYIFIMLSSCCIICCSMVQAAQTANPPMPQLLFFKQEEWYVICYSNNSYHKRGFCYTRRTLLCFHWWITNHKLTLQQYNWCVLGKQVISDPEICQNEILSSFETLIKVIFMIRIIKQLSKSKNETWCDRCAALRSCSHICAAMQQPTWSSVLLLLWSTTV